MLVLQFIGDFFQYLAGLRAGFQPWNIDLLVAEPHFIAVERVAYLHADKLRVLVVEKKPCVQKIQICEVLSLPSQRFPDIPHTIDFSVVRVEDRVSAGGIKVAHVLDIQLSPVAAPYVDRTVWDVLKRTLAGLRFVAGAVRLAHEKNRLAVGHNLPVHNGEIAGYLLLICVVVDDLPGHRQATICGRSTGGQVCRPALGEIR